MAITTYTELKTAVADWMHRSDLDASIPDCISMGESVLNRRLRLSSMFTTHTDTMPTSTRYLSLPSGFLETVSIKNTGVSPVEQLKFTKNIAEHYPSDLNSTLRPHWYTIKGQIEFNAKSDSAYPIEIEYYKKLDIATDDTNWLLTNYPDLYLFSAMMYASLYVNSAQKAAMFENRMNMLLLEVEKQEARKRGSHKGQAKVDNALTTGGPFNIESGL